MARIYKRYLTAITAQASAAISADSFSTGTQTLIDSGSGENADGADFYEIYVNVTTAPSSAAIAQIYVTEGSAGTGAALSTYALRSPIAPTTGGYKLGNLYDMAEAFYAKIYAANYGFTASLIIRPVYFADT